MDHEDTEQKGQDEANQQAQPLRKNKRHRATAHAIAQMA